MKALSVSDFTARLGGTVRELFRKYGPQAAKELILKTRAADKVTSAAEVLNRAHEKLPAGAPSSPQLVPVELAVVAAMGAFGLKAGQVERMSLAEFRAEIHGKLSGLTAQRMAELGFPSALPHVRAELDGTNGIHSDVCMKGGPNTPAARLGVLAEELNCSVDDLRKPDSGDLVRKCINLRADAMAFDGIAGIGVSIAALPESRAADEFDDLEGIQQELAREKDPVKAGRLAAKANLIRDRNWVGRQN